jgi:uncharacterized damage-inducible protein DinB
MTQVDLFRSLIAYNRWANRRILETARPLLDPQPSYTGAYGTLPDTLLHILQAQETWMARWRERQPIETEAPGADELVAAYERSHDELEAFGRELTDDDLARLITRRFSDGTEFTYTLGQQVAHLMEHGAQHRGEAALLLTLAGRSPGDLDYLDLLEGA